MLEFATNFDQPVPIRVMGVDYLIPCMTNDDWLASHQWATDQRVEKLTKDMSEDQRARFLAIWEPSPRDSLTHLNWAMSPEGIQWIIERKAKESKPTMSEAAYALISKTAPLRMRRELAALLTEAPAIIEDIKKETTHDGEANDPLSMSGAG
jgi:hypothetical protein